MQCCTCSKWVHLKCSLLPFSKFRTLGSSHFWSFPPAASLFLLETTPWLNPWTPPGCIPPLFNLAHLTPFASAAFPPNPRLQASYPPSAHFLSSPSASSTPSPASDCLSTPLAFSSPTDSLRVLQWNAGGLRARTTELPDFLSR